MKHSTLLAVSASLLLPVLASQLALGVDSSKGGGVVDEGKAKVCYPAIKSGDAAPCVEISNIELACRPNGTESIDYEAHAECMCNGSYFPNWRACQSCLLIHGLRSERDNVYWDRVLSVASNALCTGMATAEFWSIFASAQSNTKDAPFATSGDTKSSDRFPGQTDVGLYYTASGTQGPGAVTGAAASATNQHHTSAATDSAARPPGAASGISLGGVPTGGNATTAFISMPSTGSMATAASASRTSTGAAPTDGTGSGLAMAVAGAALMMAF
ncbi:hypothetical protein TOPH_05664 [Tolypocladium ophioglossoides CBS 100239]|uniref:Collagen-like protein Mcl1 n=1 Tax=Tolypocladium ophioglossoides (strain CBS 100239) TaxID=1163406 RepID=A0A0L0N6F8_TOLOC|nr:hypothetical protein TOPH_05664 [Tolypocladium ophioglossoides CBS 100239]